MSNNANMRNWKRHFYTVIREVQDPLNPQNTVEEYKRGEGLIEPSPSVASIQVGELRTEINNEIVIYTQQGFPELDVRTFSNDPNFVGKVYDPDYIVWNGVTYVAYGVNMWSKIGRNSYRKVVGFYDSSNALQWPDPREIKWDEITEFEKAVNTTEMALELKLAPIDLCSLYN